MKLSLNWLSDFVEFTEKDPQAIADAITAHTAEVDEVEEQGSLLENCCVGKILSLGKHPNADRLSICTLKTDKGEKSVVCGGTNLREGMRVVFAHVGAKVRDPEDGGLFELSKVKIRGEDSEGMICAAVELGLEAQYPPGPEDGNRPVIDLGDGDEDVGKALRDYFDFSDTVIHIDNHAITHRADLFSHIGFARECVAIGIAKWKKKPEYRLPKFPKDSLPFKIKVDDKNLIPRYCACLIEVDGIGETPDWMVSRLEATGWRSVSLPVDITNYVTMELGMPLHSFDADDLKGDVYMRGSKKGEKIVTLDKEDRELPEDSIVLSDDEGIFDLLGVMGGLRSSTKEGTKKIFLHSACVDPVSIRNTIIGTGHRTDASTIYEKGIPKVVVQQGFLRALELFLELIPGARVVSAMDNWGDDGTPEEIKLSIDKVNSVLGTEMSAKEVISALKSLEFGVQEKKEELTVTAPLHRLGDISGPHDLIEEIGRMYGFNKIEASMPTESTELPERDHRLTTLRRALKEERYIEFLPLSLLGPDLLRKCGLDPSEATEIENPIGEELSLMQPCVLPRLLDHAEQNAKQFKEVLQTFHQGIIFDGGEDACHALGILRARRNTSNLKQSSFYELKQDITIAFAAVGYEVSTQRAGNLHPAAHPGRNSVLVVGGTTIGTLFEITPTVASQFDLPPRAAAALINLTAFFGIEPVSVIAEALPQFPSVIYDETVAFSHSHVLQEVLGKASEASKLLEHIEVADLYSKEGASDYNLTLRCTYRAEDRTLTEEEAKKEHEKVMKVIA